MMKKNQVVLFALLIGSTLFVLGLLVGKEIGAWGKQGSVEQLSTEVVEKEKEIKTLENKNEEKIVEDVKRFLETYYKQRGNFKEVLDKIRPLVTEKAYGQLSPTTGAPPKEVEDTKAEYQYQSHIQNIKVYYNGVSSQKVSVVATGTLVVSAEGRTSQQGMLFEADLIFDESWKIDHIQYNRAVK